MNKNGRLGKGTVMRILSDIYLDNGVDIFNYKVSPENKVSYHHIIKREELIALGFPTTKNLENGIVLSRDAHTYLHLIEDFAPDIFYHLNKIILLITKEYRLPNYEERSLIQILLEAFEYRMQEYYRIDERFLKRVLVS